MQERRHPELYVVDPRCRPGRQCGPRPGVVARGGGLAAGRPGRRHLQRHDGRLRHQRQGRGCSQFARGDLAQGCRQFDHVQHDHEGLLQQGRLRPRPKRLQGDGGRRPQTRQRLLQLLAGCHGVCRQLRRCMEAFRRDVAQGCRDRSLHGLHHDEGRQAGAQPQGRPACARGAGPGEGREGVRGRRSLQHGLGRSHLQARHGALDEGPRRVFRLLREALRAHLRLADQGVQHAQEAHPVLGLVEGDGRDTKHHTQHHHLELHARRHRLLTTGGPRRLALRGVQGQGAPEHRHVCDVDQGLRIGRRGRPRHGDVPPAVRRRPPDEPRRLHLAH
mmetsp:Transcript_72906/g.236973  ORF Transcript_72906/g.236973 Transcript_72906/m.236973 type:complete len:332 (+) Transcript_72906:1468-2463(+)